MFFIIVLKHFINGIWIRILEKHPQPWFLLIVFCQEAYIMDNLVVLLNLDVRQATERSSTKYPFGRCWTCIIIINVSHRFLHTTNWTLNAYLSLCRSSEDWFFLIKHFWVVAKTLIYSSQVYIAGWEIFMPGGFTGKQCA